VAVNVGGTGKLPMSDLKDIWRGASGFAAVRHLHRQPAMSSSPAASPKPPLKAALKSGLEAYAGKAGGRVGNQRRRDGAGIGGQSISNAAPNRTMAVFLDRGRPRTNAGREFAPSGRT